MKKILSYVMSLMTLLVVICFVSCANPGSSSGGSGNGGEPVPCKVIIYENYPNIQLPANTDDNYYSASGHSIKWLSEEAPNDYTPGVFANFTRVTGGLEYDTSTYTTINFDRTAFIYDVEVCFPKISNKHSFAFKEYEVDHYNTKADDTGKKYYPNTNYVLTGDLELFCIYKLVRQQTEQEILDYIAAHPEILNDD